VAKSRSAGNVGFIGFGNYARGVLVPALRKAGGVTLTTVVTSTGLSAGHAADKYGFRTVATDPAAVLGDPETDTIFIATRHDTHAALTRAALDAGKHVFCEKPLALDDAELQAVLNAAARSTGILAVGFNRRFAPLLVKAKAALEPRSGPLVMLYRVNAGAVPAESWIRRSEGGGRIIGEICHFIDALCFLAGSIPVEVTAVAARGHDDAVSLLLKLADGSTGTIVYSSLGDAAVPKEQIEAFAAGRVVQIDDFCRLTISAAGRQGVTKAAQDKGQQGLVAAFLAAAKSGGAPPIPLSEIAAVSETTYAAVDSLLKGATVSRES
jgi:polar amino acid transport system substrate-binding protein